MRVPKCLYLRVQRLHDREGRREEQHALALQARASMMADARERLDVWRNVFLKLECAEKCVGAPPTAGPPLGHY